jgi:hypothetical protein
MNIRNFTAESGFNSKNKYFCREKVDKTTKILCFYPRRLSKLSNRITKMYIFSAQFQYYSKCTLF